jgi:phospholipase C
MIIASPWTRGGKVCSQVFDHTSSLQFLEEFLNKKFNRNIRETNITSWRRTVCGNLTSAFTLYNDQEKEKLPFLSRDPFFESVYNAKFKNPPSNYKKLSQEEIEQINRDLYAHLVSQQEPGVRPSRPLPYELYADGGLGADKKNFELAMHAGNAVFGSESAGSPFIVYAPGEYLMRGMEKNREKIFDPVRAWHYAVKAGDTLSDKWPLDAFKGDGYHLRVYGPNGFFREFTGNANDPLLQVYCQYQQKRLLKNKLTGNLLLRIINRHPSESYAIEIVDKAYKSRPVHKRIAASSEETVILELGKSFGWYDFAILVKGSPVFAKRLAGRVETGEEGFTDPFMGKSI